MRQSLDGTLRSGGGLLELLGLAHIIFPIILENLKGPFMHGRSAKFSPTLLVEVEGNQLIRLVVSHSLTSVWM